MLFFWPINIKRKARFKGDLNLNLYVQTGSDLLQYSDPTKTPESGSAILQKNTLLNLFNIHVQEPWLGKGAKKKILWRENICTHTLGILS